MAFGIKDDTDWVENYTIVMVVTAYVLLVSFGRIPVDGFGLLAGFVIRGILGLKNGDKKNGV